MLKDRAELGVTTQSVEAVAAFDQALQALLEYRLEASAHSKRALEVDPDFVMGLVFRGLMLMQLGTNQVHGKVAQTLDAAKQRSRGCTNRERAHITALEHWMHGRTKSACDTWEQILVESPGDLLALRLHHFTSFWRGERVGLRDVPAMVVGRLGSQAWGYGFAVGMLAFGFEESGDYGRAEEWGRAAVDANPNDLWAIHAMAHVLEMQNRVLEGTQWLDQPVGSWADRNPFKDHLWWHTALFWLEQGQLEQVLTLYDAEIQADQSGFYLDVQNAASLLMRLELVECDVGSRWEHLADLAESRLDDHHLPFTDCHFMMALAGARRLDTAERYLKSLEEFASHDEVDAAHVIGSVGLAITRALYAYARGDHEQVVSLLSTVRRNMAPLGGSHAQQDIFSQLLLDSAIRANQVSVANALLAERTTLRPSPVFTDAKFAERIAGG